MIDVTRLTKRYGDRLAVDDVSFSIGRGEVCGFLGPNGAGKTTTLRAITGFLAPTSGSVSVAGFDVAERPLEAKRRIGYLPESTPLYPDMRVGEFLAFVCRVKGITGTALRDELGRVMAATHIADRERSLVKSLSKGYRQRVGIAQALVGDPDVLILDEPTVGLDPEQINDVRGFIRELAGRHTIILSSHILPEVQAVCSKVLIINKGKLIAADTPENLARRFAHADRIRLTLVAGVDAATGVASLPTVAAVEKTGEREGRLSLAVTPKEGGLSAARKEIIGLVAANGWELMELAGEAASLEEVYLSVVTSDPAEGEA